MKYALILLVVVVLALHQDLWNWTNKSLVFGFLPVGLAYHAGYALLASATMAVLVHFLWPKELDREGEAGAAVPVSPVPAGVGGQEAEP